MRRHRVDDLADCAAMWGDAAGTRYIGGKPLSREETWARLLRYHGHWELLGFGHWLVEEKAGGGFVGEVGFADFKRDIEPSLDGMPEMGWVLASRWHGRGLATEAVRAAAAWGDVHFGARRTACMIHVENVASIRVAEKCGFQKWQTTTYRGQAMILFERQGGQGG